MFREQRKKKLAREWRRLAKACLIDISSTGDVARLAEDLFKRGATSEISREMKMSGLAKIQGRRRGILGRWAENLGLSVAKVYPTSK